MATQRDTTAATVMTRMVVVVQVVVRTGGKSPESPNVSLIFVCNCIKTEQLTDIITYKSLPKHKVKFVSRNMTLKWELGFIGCHDLKIMMHV